MDKNEAEFYQVTLGGRQGNDAQLGKVIGPSFSAEEMPDVVEKSSRYTSNTATWTSVPRHPRPHRRRPFKNRVYEGRAHGKAKQSERKVA